MEKRRLGRTGHMSTLAIFGAAAFYVTEDQATADATLDLMEQHGVNHIDVAPGYQLAQARIGPWLESRRDRFFLGCKTQERQRDAAWADLRTSLRLLRTDHFDLYQLHAVTNLAELDAAFAPGGAMEVLVEAREQGITRWLGITGHGLQAPATFLEALRRFDFDTVMFPLNPRLYADPNYRRDAERLLAECAARDVGVQIIKSVTKGPWGEREKLYNTWYLPFDDAAGITQGVRFALSQPVTCIATPAEMSLLPLVYAAVENFTPMSAAEQEAVIAAAGALEPLFT